MRTADEAEHFVRSPCQFCREFQTVFSSLLRVGLSPPPSGEGQRGRRENGSPTAPPDGACIKAMVVRRGGVWGELD